MDNNLITYGRYMELLKPSEVYEGLMWGMFAERLPPIFTNGEYLKFISRKKSYNPGDESYGCIAYDNMRNTGAYRRLSIPVPFAYAGLCAYIRDGWVDNLVSHFKSCTKEQKHKISRIHIRHLKDSHSIFKMNYNNWKFDEDPLLDLRIYGRFVVETDISSCFPSIYTHSIAWAIDTKKKAKANMRATPKICSWADRLDECVRKMSDKETAGLLIGPHASNVLSEIILVRVDEKLQQKYNYIRHIDDYTCFTETREEAEAFIAELKSALAEYKLSINFKKTKIKELPCLGNEDWNHLLKARLAQLPSSPAMLHRSDISSLIDFITVLMSSSGSASVVSFTMRALSKRYFTEEARIYYVKSMMHMAFHNPYLFFFLDEYVLQPFDVSEDLLKELSDRMISRGLKVCNYEMVAYAFYYALRYGFDLSEINPDDITKTGDCVLMVAVWHYAKCRGLSSLCKVLKNKALELSADADDFNRNWLFVYEALTKSELSGRWAELKHSGVSFLKHVEAMTPTHTPSYETYPIMWDCRIREACLQYKALQDRFLSDNVSLKSEGPTCECLNAIIANLIVCSRLRRNVTIPRSDDYYLKSKIKVGTTLIDVVHVKLVLNWLKSRQLIGERRGTKTFGVSSFWPKDELSKEFKDVDLNNIQKLDNVDEIVMKDSRKQVTEYNPNNPVCKKYKVFIAKMNALYAGHTFAAQFEGSSHVDGFVPRLKAVFNDSSWGHGGRFYASATQIGFNYQCIPSNTRKKAIRIDGVPAAEVDYKSMHPSILYALNGVPFSGNAYDFLPVEDSALAKFTLLVVLNAKSKKSALGALKSRLEELRSANGLSPKKMALRDALLRNDLDDVLRKAAVRHKSLIRRFYSGVGVRLQNIEARIAMDVMRHFADKGIPILPMHDSFIIQEKYKAALATVMRAVFAKHFPGCKCQVK